MIPHFDAQNGGPPNSLIITPPTHLGSSGHSHGPLAHAIRSEEHRVLGDVCHEGRHGARVEAPDALLAESADGAPQHGLVQGGEGLHLHLHCVHGLARIHRYCGAWGNGRMLLQGCKDEGNMIIGNKIVFKVFINGRTLKTSKTKIRWNYAGYYILSFKAIYKKRNFLFYSMYYSM